MKTWRAVPMASVAMLAAMIATSARADYGLPSFFVSDPTKDSQEWATAVAAEGGKLNDDVDFRSMPTGVLASRFYDSTAHPDGVTLTASDSSIDNVMAGPGPGQLGQKAPVSAGEGTSNLPAYLLSSSPGPGGGSSLTISFATPAIAVGLFTIDYFGSDTSTNALTLSIYSGPNGTGTLLGSALAAQQDFQPNGLYFMGYVSSAANIGSAVFGRGADRDGDAIGIGPILFADQGTNLAAVPEPSALASLALGGALAIARRRRRAG